MAKLIFEVFHIQKFLAIRYCGDVELKIAINLFNIAKLYTQDECSLKLSCRDLNNTKVLIVIGYLSGNFCSIIDNRKQYLKKKITIKTML